LIFKASFLNIFPQIINNSKLIQEKTMETSSRLFILLAVMTITSITSCTQASQFAAHAGIDQKLGAGRWLHRFAEDRERENIYSYFLYILQRW
jgi:hypothetical protein